MYGIQLCLPNPPGIKDLMIDAHPNTLSSMLPESFAGPQRQC